MSIDINSTSNQFKNNNGNYVAGKTNERKMVDAAYDDN
jgi:hypothetical protein